MTATHFAMLGGGTRRRLDARRVAGCPAPGRLDGQDHRARRAPAPKTGPRRQLAFGALMAFVVPALFAAASLLVLVKARPYPALEFLVGVVLLKSTFALRALATAARKVERALGDDRIDDARFGLRSLCSRDPSNLGPSELVAATIESVAENASDSFVAPLVYFALFGVPAAVAYRAVNTLDAMIGYHGRYEYLGKASARLDDVLNWIPARLTAGLLLLAGVLGGAIRSARRARKNMKLRIAVRVEHACHSPTLVLEQRKGDRDPSAARRARSLRTCPDTFRRGWRESRPKRLHFPLLRGGAHSHWFLLPSRRRSTPDGKVSAAVRRDGGEAGRYAEPALIGNRPQLHRRGSLVLDGEGLLLDRERAARSTRSSPQVPDSLRRHGRGRRNTELICSPALATNVTELALRAIAVCHAFVCAHAELAWFPERQSASIPQRE